MHEIYHDMEKGGKQDTLERLYTKDPMEANDSLINRKEEALLVVITDGGKHLDGIG